MKIRIRDVPLGRRRIDEDRLAELHLARERLELLLRDLARVGEDGDLVPRERHVGEDVGNDVAEGRHVPSEPQGTSGNHSRRNMQKRRFAPSPAMVVSLIALFVALGGTSYAAITMALPKNSVGTKQIKNGAVTAAKISSSALARQQGRRRSQERPRTRNGWSPAQSSERRRRLVLQGSVGDRPPPGQRRQRRRGDDRRDLHASGRRPAGQEPLLHRLRQWRQPGVRRRSRATVP